MVMAVLLLGISGMSALQAQKVAKKGNNKSKTTVSTKKTTGNKTTSSKTTGSKSTVNKTTGSKTTGNKSTVNKITGLKTTGNKKVTPAVDQTVILNKKFDSLKVITDSLQREKQTAENQAAESQRIISVLAGNVDSLTRINEELQNEKHNLQAQKDTLANHNDTLTREWERAKNYDQLKAQKTGQVETKKTVTIQPQAKNDVSVNTQNVQVSVPQSVPQLVPHMTSGRFFNEPITDANHLLTKEEIAEMYAFGRDSVMNPQKWYTLSSGLKVQLLHPKEWNSLVLKSYQAIDKNITEENIIEAIEASEATVWNSSMPLTKNYYWSHLGQIACINDYNGACLEQKVAVITYKGSPTVKRSCANPQLPN